MVVSRAVHSDANDCAAGSVIDLSRVLAWADGFVCRWIELLISVRTIAAFENLLRGKQLGGQLQGGNLWSLRAGGIVIDTACLIGDLVEVVASGNGESAARMPAQEAADQATASKQSGRSGADEQQPQATQSGAAATDSIRRVQQQQWWQVPQQGVSQEGMWQLGRLSGNSAGLRDCDQQSECQ